MARAFTNNRTDAGPNVRKDFGGKPMFHHASRVLAAGEDWIDLERPLHVDVELAFSPTLFR